MGIDELARLSGFSPRTINTYVSRGLIPRPMGYGRWARYGQQHVEALVAYRALRHNNTALGELGGFLKEEGIGIVEYVRRREQAIRAHGLGVA